MKKSVIIAFIIFLAVTGWFLSGTISIGNEHQNDQSYNDSSNDNNNDIGNNILKVESEIVYSEEIEESITLQGQTIHNRTIDIKSETTGNIINKNYKRGKIVTSDEILVEISMEDRQELLSSFTQELERNKKEILINEKKRDNSIYKIKEQIKLYEIEYQSAKQLIDKGLSSKSKLSLASFNLANSKSNLRDIEYFPVVYALSELKLNPSFLENLNPDGLIGFPVVPLIVHSFFYKIFGIYSFVFLEIFFKLIFFLVLIKFLNEME